MTETTGTPWGIDDATKQEIDRLSRRELPELRDRYEVVYEDEEVVVLAVTDAEFTATASEHDVEYRKLIEWMNKRCPSRVRTGINTPFEYGTPFVVAKASNDE